MHPLHDAVLAEEIELLAAAIAAAGEVPGSRLSSEQVDVVLGLRPVEADARDAASAEAEAPWLAPFVASLWSDQCLAAVAVHSDPDAGRRGAGHVSSSVRPIWPLFARSDRFMAVY